MSFWDSIAAGLGVFNPAMLLGPIGQMVGTGMTNATNTQNTRETNAANMGIANAQMAFQERMSGSAHQREVEDLRKAGLNPMLSGMGGSGSSTPSGASATMVAPQVEDVLGKGISSALDFRRLKKELDQTESQVDLNASLKQVADKDAVVKSANARTAKANAEIAEASVPAAIVESQNDLERARFDRGLVKYDSVAKRVARDAGAITNAIGAGLRGQFRSKPRGDYYNKRTGEIYSPLP